MKPASQWQQAFDEVGGLVVDVPTTEDAQARRLPRALIQTRPALFQGRDLHVKANAEQSNTHIEKLREKKRHTGRMDAVRVWKAGGVWWLLQGHHRLALFDLDAAAAPRKPRLNINVTICKARSLREALAETYEEGAKLHLNKTGEALDNLAWQLVQVKDEITTADIVLQTGLSKSQVNSMRRTVARLRVMIPEVEWEGWPWRRVLMYLNGRGEGKGANDDMWERSFTKQWRTAFGMRPGAHPRPFSKVMYKEDPEGAVLIAHGILAEKARQDQTANPFAEQCTK